MKRLASPWLVIGLVWLLPSRGHSLAAPAGDTSNDRAGVIARIHSLGPQAWNADATGRTFKEVWNLPITAQLREETARKLAVALAARFAPKEGGATGNCARLLQPLLSDLLNHEASLEILQRPSDQVEATFAARIDEARGRVWQTNYAQLVAGWNWKTGGQARLELAATNGWVAIRCLTGGGGQDAAADGLFRNIRFGQVAAARPQEYWLKVEADLARAGLKMAQPARASLPFLALTVTGHRDSLRSQAKLTFRDPVISRIEKWEIPTETIRDPLISFTALQGIGPWLKRQPWFQELALDRVPNQLYLWGLSQTAFQLQAAVPVADAPSAYARVVDVGVPKYNRTLQEYSVGSINRMTNRIGFMWTGLPILVPYLRPVTDHGHSFLHGGIFPLVSPSTNSPPPELFQELSSQPSLLYYDWEVTQARLEQLRPLLQLGAVFMTVSPMSTNSTPYRWLDAIEPRLGNAVTAASLASPHEVTVQRTAHLGLNGLELLALANWLEGTNFPHLNLEMGFRPVVLPGTTKSGR